MWLQAPRASDVIPFTVALKTDPQMQSLGYRQVTSSEGQSNSTQDREWTLKGQLLNLQP